MRHRLNWLPPTVRGLKERKISLSPELLLEYGTADLQSLLSAGPAGCRHRMLAEPSPQGRRPSFVRKVRWRASYQRKAAAGRRVMIRVKARTHQQYVESNATSCLLIQRVAFYSLLRQITGATVTDEKQANARITD